MNNHRQNFQKHLSKYYYLTKLQYNHLFFLAVLAIIYIGNVHYGERMIRETTKMENEVENLRSDYASLKAKYDSYTGKQINIAESAKKLGLQESKGRIQKITVGK